MRSQGARWLHAGCTGMQPGCTRCSVRAAAYERSPVANTKLPCEQVRLSDGGSVSLLWATPSAGPREAGAPVLLLLPGVNNDAHMGYVKHVQAVAARACRHDLSTAHPLYSAPSLQHTLSTAHPLYSAPSLQHILSTARPLFTVRDGHACP